MKSVLKRLASKLPKKFQQELKRSYFFYQIKRGKFGNLEDEFFKLDEYLSEGDWVIDVGANIGHYTVNFSKKVGKRGRVIAIEPVPDSFELLSSNVALLSARNVTLLNIAASDSWASVGFKIPAFRSGLRNYYQAYVTREKPEFTVLSMPIDSLGIPHRIRLAKIDAEGHDYFVLKGMEGILLRDRPLLIIEDGDPQIIAFLGKLGYSCEKKEGSPNMICQYSS